MFARLSFRSASLLLVILDAYLESSCNQGARSGYGGTGKRDQHEASAHHDVKTSHKLH